MRKIHEVLRLKWQCGLSNRQIATSCSIGAGTVWDYLRRARSAGLCWPLPEGMTDAQLEQQLYPAPLNIPAPARPLPDWSQVHQELTGKGVTLVLLWEEYRASHPSGYGYSRFCELYEKWREVSDPRMHQLHKAGEKLFVDYAGQTVPLTDRKTGEIREAQLFVATLGASNYTFAEATWTQALPDWIASHVRAFAFFGGVPELLVPDNLKSGVRSACFYEPDLNPTYLDLARHYGVAVLPARVRKPRDKAKVENGVQQAERRILAALRHRTFFELSDLNEAIAAFLDALNRRISRPASVSRLDLFETLEKPVLRPLPAQPYQPALWKKARVHIDYHVSVEGHWYSVPYRFVREEVDVRITAATVEFFLSGERIASHLRSERKYAYTTLPEHMPASHRFFAEWTPQRLIEWAKKSGPCAAELVEKVLSSRVHPEQAFRSCLGILRLGQEFGADRLEAACQRALLGQTLTYRSLKAILQNNLDRAPLPQASGTQVEGATPIQHANIRGAAYYNSSNGSQ